MSVRLPLGLFVSGLLCFQATAATTVTGAGATFPFPAYTKWASDYQKQTGNQINYQPIGSGGGIKQIEAGTVDFGATDKPLHDDELNQYHLLQFPTLLGAVVPVVNLDGVNAGELKLTGPVLADIFMGKITRWSDPAIASLNPQIKLVDKPITVVHRSDGSGTTFLFTNYLGKVSPEFLKSVGSDATVNWPTGMAGKGNEGLAVYVKQIPGSIGYVEYSYAKTGNLAYVSLQNHAGKFVQPGQDSIKAAAEKVDWNQSFVLLTDASGDNAWPISGATFILISKQINASAAEKTQATLKFFQWGYEQGKQAAESLDYVSLPQPLISQIKQRWASELKDDQGKPVYTAGN